VAVCRRTDGDAPSADDDLNETDGEAMSKLTKLYLVLGVLFSLAGILFNADVLGTGGVTACYVALPLGAVFLGLFIVCRMLGQEAARFDAEHPDRH
jgi:hypothetical protein